MKKYFRKRKNYPAKSELHDYSVLLDLRLIYQSFFEKNLLDNISIDSAIEKSCNYLKIILITLILK